LNIEEKDKTNIRHLTSQLESNTMIEKAAGSGSESATKIEQKSLKNESDKYRDSQPQNTLNDYNDDKPMMTGI